MLNKKLPRNLHRWRLFAFLLVVVMPSLGVGLGLAASFGTQTMERDVALAVYGAQIQMFTLFATIAPVFFVFFEYRRPAKTEIETAALFCILEIVASLAGMSFSFSFMVMSTKAVYVSMLGTPFFFATLAATALLLFLLDAADMLQPVYKWITSR